MLLVPFPTVIFILPLCQSLMSGFLSTSRRLISRRWWECERCECETCHYIDLTTSINELCFECTMARAADQHAHAYQEISLFSHNKELKKMLLRIIALCRHEFMNVVVTKGLHTVSGNNIPNKNVHDSFVCRADTQGDKHKAWLKKQTIPINWK